MRGELQLSLGRRGFSFGEQKPAVMSSSSWEIENPLHDTRIPKPYSCPWGHVALALGDRGLQLMFTSHWKMESLLHDTRILVTMRDIKLKEINSKEVCTLACILTGRKRTFREKVKCGPTS